MDECLDGFYVMNRVVATFYMSSRSAPSCEIGAFSELHEMEIR